MEDIVAPEAKINQLLQLLALLIERLGGEVVVSHQEFSMFEDVPVVGRKLSPNYVVLRLGDEDEKSLEQGRPLDDWPAE